MQSDTEHRPYLEKHIIAGRQGKGTGGQGGRKGMDHKVSDILTNCILMVKAVRVNERDPPSSCSKSLQPLGNKSG